MLDARLMQRLDAASCPAPSPFDAARRGADARPATPPDGVAPDLAGGGDAPGPFGPVEIDYALPRALVVSAHHETRRRLAAIIGTLWAAVPILACAALLWAPLVLAALACAVALWPLQKLEHFLSSVCAEAERRRAA